jgi:hypothetical protein
LVLFDDVMRILSWEMRLAVLPLESARANPLQSNAHALSMEHGRSMIKFMQNGHFFPNPVIFRGL